MGVLTFNYSYLNFFSRKLNKYNKYTKIYINYNYNILNDKLISDNEYRNT